MSRFTMETFKQYTKTTPQIDCWVVFSPITKKIKLTRDGRREIHFCNDRGNLFCFDGRIGQSYEVIGRLVQKHKLTKNGDIIFLPIRGR